MFDILTDSAVPTEVELPENLKCALDSCRKIFKNLPSSPERDSALNALGVSALLHSDERFVIELSF